MRYILSIVALCLLGYLLANGQGGIGGKAGIGGKGGIGGGISANAPTFAQACGTQGTSSATIVCTFSGAVTTGQMLVGGVAQYSANSGTSTISSVTDNCNTGGTSDTYALHSNSAFTSPFDGAIGGFTAVVGLGRTSCAVTVALTASNGFTDVIIHTVNNASTYDTSTAQPQSAPGAGTNALTSGSMTTGFADYVFAMTADLNAGNNTFSAGTGFTAQGTASGTGINAQGEYQVQGSAGAIAGTFTASTGSGSYATIAIGVH